MHTETKRIAPAKNPSRRDFIRQTSVLPLALSAAQASAEAADPQPSSQLPQIRLGKLAVSRLICGGNPFNGGSHLSNMVSREMRSYYTPEQVLKTLHHCQAAGINCWQSSKGGSGSAGLELYRRFIAEGGQMHYLAIASDQQDIPTLAAGGCAGIAHHGEATDTLFKAGKLDQVREFTKRVRDAGLLTGISTHMPAVVEAVESMGWDLDFYMTCVYERNRSPEEVRKLLGYVPIPARELYLEEDLPRMFKIIRQTRRTCLAFKILAAGRLCESKNRVEQAFRETFAAIKPTDAVIIGIYDRYSDQAVENAALTRKFGIV